jgi:hypothetical protein
VILVVYLLNKLFSKFHRSLNKNKINVTVQKGHHLNMQIADLNYLNNILEDDFVLGSDGISVTSEASTLSTSGTETISAFTISYGVETSSSGVSTSEGTGLTLAVGEQTTTSVTVTSVTDPEIIKFKSKKNLI